MRSCCCGSVAQCGALGTTSAAAGLQRTALPVGVGLTLIGPPCRHGACVHVGLDVDPIKPAKAFTWALTPQRSVHTCKQAWQAELVSRCTCATSALVQGFANTCAAHRWRSVKLAPALPIRTRMKLTRAHCQLAPVSHVSEHMISRQVSGHVSDQHCTGDLMLQSASPSTMPPVLHTLLRMVTA